MKSLLLTKLTILYFIHLVNISQADDNLFTCVDSYVDGTDYFPQKALPEYANFAVEYHNSYKVLSVSKASIDSVETGATIVLYQCGTPQPTVANADIYIPIPVSSVALASTVYIPYIELLGERLSIDVVATDLSLVASPCLNEMVVAGETVGAYDSSSWSIDNTVLQDQAVEATFVDGIWGDWSNLHNGIPVIEYTETSSHTSIMEWLLFFSYFYNKEAEAKAALEGISDRYDCHKDLVADEEDKPNVLWISSFWGGNFNFASCPNYYCELVQNAGGNLVNIGEGAVASGDAAALVGVAASADIILFADSWQAKVMDDPEVSNIVSAIPAVANQNVYDVHGNGAQDWFESRYVEPDVVLEDLISIFHNCVHPEHTRVWWRHAFREDPDSVDSCSGSSAWGEPLVTKADECADSSDCEVTEASAGAKPILSLMGALLTTCMTLLSW
eukprot:CAMPEP_0113944358 /NCGR_PEP_ID=MMETSP1339-20121228/33728_1 /TAXON_ID=94617 /ORGANISM="Fibrocapsa japonica" /LENGTH=444 /DNA_ID=CAMNT_0000949535 /DNA_START=61 /DNA_END=1392 /DNA_ORIENTATION=- /assembly_acc=CAM_ASM_000762